jgi:hypothetical protein
MYTSDKRILHLIDYLIYKKEVSTAGKFSTRVNMLATTISKVRSGKTHFTVNQIESICKEFNVNANWIFGMDSKVFNTPDSIDIKEIQ